MQKQPAPAPRVARAAGLSHLPTFLVAAGALLIILIFAAQNTRRADVVFFFWDWNGAPLFVVLLLPFLAGLVLGTLLSSVIRGRIAK